MLAWRGPRLTSSWPQSWEAEAQPPHYLWGWGQGGRGPRVPLAGWRRAGLCEQPRAQGNRLAPRTHPPMGPWATCRHAHLPFQSTARGCSPSLQWALFWGWGLPRASCVSGHPLWGWPAACGTEAGCPAGPAAGSSSHCLHPPCLQAPPLSGPEVDHPPGAPHAPPVLRLWGTGAELPWRGGVGWQWRDPPEIVTRMGYRAGACGLARCSGA